MCGEWAKGEAGSPRTTGKVGRGPGVMKCSGLGWWLREGGLSRQSRDYFASQGESRVREA